MSVVLFNLVNGKLEKELCDPLMLDDLLKSGYSLSSCELLNQDKGAKLKLASKPSGIRSNSKSTKKPKEELRL